MEMITVLYECDDGWHKFTSPELPGLYMIVPPDDIAAACADLPSAIEALIYADTGTCVEVRPQRTFAAYVGERKDDNRLIPQYYSIERRAA